MNTDHTRRAKQLSDQEAFEFLVNLRTTSLANSYVLRFKLKHYPPKERTIVFYGNLYGVSDPATGVTTERLILEKRDGYNSSGFTIIKDALIVRSGTPQVWIKEDEQVSRLSDMELGNPILDGITLTYNDLLTPYLYWNEYEYVGPSKVKARPTQSFKMKSPVDPETYVTIDLDNEFGAILKAELFSTGEDPLNAMELISFKKTSGEYIPKIVDYRDYVNKGHKSRIDIIAAALDVPLPAALFQIEKLSEPFPKIDPIVFDVF